MAECPCDEPVLVDHDIAAGLDALPHQLRTFATVRQALLRGIPQKLALSQWRARGGRDLGVMWLEMWAYLSDSLAFYDERIANESYLRTAAQRKALRRIVAPLGRLPAPGVGALAVLAAFADGKEEVRVPAQTAFRSDAFGNEPPQIFETKTETPIHPLKNQWQIVPFKRGNLPAFTPSQAPGKPGENTPLGTYFVFESTGFGLAKDSLALFEIAGSTFQFASRVKSITPLTGKDTRNYVEVEFDPPVALPSVPASSVRVRVPTITAGITKSPRDSSDSRLFPRGGETIAALDAAYRQIRLMDPIIFTVEATQRVVTAAKASGVLETFVFQREPNRGSPLEVRTAARIPVTELHLDRLLAPLSAPDQVSFHFGFVHAGSVVALPDDRISRAEFSTGLGVPVAGIIEQPPGVKQGELSQEFLLVDTDGKVAQVTGLLRFGGAGHSTFFKALESDDLTADSYKAPITLYGNLLEVSRGETTFNEVLGNGDAKQQSQEFVLGRKPLTYSYDPDSETGIASTLDVKVDGISWTEVPSFYARSPEDEVFIVRHDDDQNTRVIFGDGVRGARLPTGVENVVATYRAGAGTAAPPNNGITQIARPFLGLRAIRASLTTRLGRDSDTTDDLRGRGPDEPLLFQRAVSVQDFETLTMTTGVIQAVAEFRWLEAQQRAGVQVTYIGNVADKDIRELLEKRAEKNLPIFVTKATPRNGKLTIDLIHDVRFNRATVEQRVHETLTAVPDGVLSLNKAEIGGQFWVSRLYRAIQDVPGVVAVRDATLALPSASSIFIKRATSPLGIAGTGLQAQAVLLGSPRAPLATFALAPLDVVCSPSGTYLDFTAEGAVVIEATSSAATTNPNARRRREV